MRQACRSGLGRWRDLCPDLLGQPTERASTVRVPDSVDTEVPVRFIGVTVWQGVSNWLLSSDGRGVEIQ
jgi:hypothetical protein